MNLTLRQLEYLVAIADHGGFGKAARACHVTQPALSAQVAQLERVLGFRLMERGPRVTLTPAGVELVARAREILGRVAELEHALPTLREPLGGPLRLGVIPTIAPYVLPRLLPAMRQRFPKLHLFLREGLTADLVADLHAGRLDVLLLALPVELGAAESLEVYSESFVALVPSSHALAGNLQVTQRELKSDELLLLDDGHCLREHVVLACRLRKEDAMADFRASSLHTLVRLVEAGLGVTLLPAMAVQSETAHVESVRVVPFKDPAPHRRVGLAWRSSSVRAEEFKVLGDLISRVCSGEGSKPPQRRSSPQRARGT